MGIEAQLQAAFAQAAIPGAVALIADRDGVRFTGAYGHADAISGQAMEVDTVFQIASMTKAVVSAGAMQLVEQGRLDLDAPVGDLLPQLAAPQVLSG
ncbi:MAG: serine hydrolase domain-containing protein, partial [Sphingomonadales bacterium]